MAYTKVGPFTDNSASPPINAAFLNGVENTLVSVSPLTGFTTYSSGASFQIGLPAYSSGLLLISGSAGGAWFTGYVGAYVTSSTGAAITQLSSQTLGPGNLISSVTASTSSLNLTVVTASTGSNSAITSAVLRGTL